MTLCCECRISECLARPCKCNEVFLSVFPTVLATNPFEENFQHVTCISTSRHLSSASSPVLKEDEEQECIAQLKVALYILVTAEIRKCLNIISFFRLFSGEFHGTDDLQRAVLGNKIIKLRSC